MNSEHFTPESLNPESPPDCLGLHKDFGRPKTARVPPPRHGLPAVSVWCQQLSQHLRLQTAPRPAQDAYPDIPGVGEADLLYMRRMTFLIGLRSSKHFIITSVALVRRVVVYVT